MHNPTPWRSLLLRALHRNRSKPFSRYLQLATVRRDGRPANRTLVFRGFLGESSCLQMVTDSRSEKIEQIEQQAWGEICWYFTQTREQFRFSGELILVAADNSEEELLAARRQVWHNLSAKARAQFAWPEPKQVREEGAAFEVPELDPEKPLENFCLLLLVPKFVDHLELKGEPQNRHLYVYEEQQGWQTREVNP